MTKEPDPLNNKSIHEAGSHTNHSTHFRVTLVGGPSDGRVVNIAKGAEARHVSRTDTANDLIHLATYTPGPIHGFWVCRSHTSVPRSQGMPNLRTEEED